jgi:hypothetical protein
MPKVVEPEPIQVQVRLKRDCPGGFHNLYDVKRGQVVTIPERDAMRYYLTDLVEPLDAAAESPEDRKARLDRARQVMIEDGLAMQKAAREPYEQARRAVIAAQAADKKRRVGWH